jgi:hypothetical protein
VIGGAEVNNARDTYIERAAKYESDYLVVMYGANDILRQNPELTMPLFKNDLAEIITGLKTAGFDSTKIVVGSTTVLGTMESTVSEYTSAARSVADSLGCLYTNVNGYLMSHGGVGTTSDGVHPTAIGMQLVADAYYKTYSGVDTAVISTSGDVNAPIIGGGLFYIGERCTLYCSPGSGYGATWPGGTVAYPNSDTLIILVSGDSTVASVSYTTQCVIDSVRPNPQWRSDSATIRGSYFGSAGVLRNITTSENVSQKYWSDTQIDYYIPPTWPRGWNRLVVTNPDSLRDTLSQYIAIIRKAN